MKSPRTVKEIQSIIGRATFLSEFLSRSTDKCMMFFTTIKNSKGLLWTDKCEEALTKLKEYLSKPPLISKPINGEYLYLYLAISDCAVSASLIREDSGEQKLVYYISKAFLEPNIRY